MTCPECGTTGALRSYYPHCVAWLCDICGYEWR